MIDESLTSADIKNNEVKNSDLASNSVGTGRIIDGTIGSIDLAGSSVGSWTVENGSLRSEDVAPNSLSGLAIREDGLVVKGMGCQKEKINGYARIKGSSSMDTFYGLGEADRLSNCASGVVEVRRSSVGVYYVRFPYNPSTLALVVSNSDNSGSENTAARDNIVSVARIADGSCGDCGAFRVQVEDVSATGTGTGTTPTDGWFTIMVM